MIAPAAETATTTWRALGTGVRLVVNGGEIDSVRAAVQDVLDAVDRAYSRFRPDSEIVGLNARPDSTVSVSPLLADAIEVALAVADEATIKQLDKYKQITARLTDPRTIADADAKQLIAAGKPIYYASGSIHSPETGSPEMLTELADFRLVFRCCATPRPSTEDRLADLRRDDDDGDPDGPAGDHEHGVLI